MDSPPPELATQALDDESPPSSPEITLTATLSVPDSPLMDSTLPDTLADVTQVLEDAYSGEETQALEDVDIDFDELGTTQVLDSEDEDGGTQVVDDSDGGSEDDVTVLVDGEETQILEDLSGEKCDSGCADSVHTSGLAAASKFNDRGTDHEAGYIQGNSQSEKEAAHKSNEVSGISGPPTEEMQDGETGGNHCSQNCSGVTGRKCRVAKPTVRRLFPEVSPDNDTSLSEFETNTQQSAGLSYMLSQPSQEPGDILNALNTVDKYISINKEDSPQERNWGSARKQKSPLSSAKGTKTLAFTLRNTIGEAGIFDWDDNQDEGGGYFFSKRKEELFGGGCHARGSYTQPKNQRPRNAKKGRGTMDRLGKKDDDLNLSRRMERLTHSDSRLLVDKLNEDEKQHVFKSRARKNLSKGLNAVQNLGTSSGQSEEHDNPENDTTGFSVDEKKKVNSKRASRSRFSVPGGTLRRSGRMKKPDTSLSTETSSKISSEEKMTGFASGSKTKGKERKINAVKNTDTSSAAIKNTTTDRRCSKSTKGVNSVSAVNKIDLKEADKFYRSSTSNGNISAMKEQTQEDYRIVTPVHPRTRKSSAVNPLKRSRLCSDSGDGAGEMEAGETKGGQRGLDVDESNREGQRYKLLSDLIGSVARDKPLQQEPSNSISHEEIAKTSSVTNDKQIQQESSNHILHEEIAKTSYEKKNICRYPLRKRTHQNMANDISGFANVDIQSTEQDVESNEKSMSKQKKLKTVRNTSVKIDHKRITRSSVHQSLVSSDKKCDGSLTRQSVLNSAFSGTSNNCSTPVMTAKLVLKDKDTASTYSSKERGEGSMSSIEGGHTKSRSDMSSVEKLERHFTACFTPTSKCTTPINIASPVITSDNHTNRFGKNNLSRSPLMRAAKKLDANEVMQSPASKDLRRKKDMANVRVLFSRHLGEDIIRQQKKILLRLGASVACSPAEATHFVTDTFVRTRNMLESIASGKPIVTRLWLESCGQARCFIDEKNYIMRDSKKEKEIEFSMPVSLARATQSPLLEGKRVYITENVNPSKELISCLVKAVHGQVVERIGRSATKDKFPDDLLVISSEEDYATCAPLIKKGAVIYNSDLLLNGIVIQKLDYGRHCLFTDHVKKTRSTTWLRRTDGDQFVPVAKHK